MDITIPHSLLSKYLKTKASPTEIAQALSLCGPTVDFLESVDSDWLYHVEIITNRVDAASAYGLAREAAAILPEFGHPAELTPLSFNQLYKTVTQTTLPPINLTVDHNPALNPRLLGIIIEDVVVKESPPWLKQTLIKLGQRPLNTIVDITNYVMYELGHPVHAFDYDRLSTKKIMVREAKSGETLITLDDRKHLLKGGEIVYDDGTGNIIDLPGIMGTMNSAITPTTKKVLLWIETNNPAKIRFTSLTHQIRTQAAILNEKGVDPFLALPAFLRSLELMLQYAHGKVACRLLDIFPHPPVPHEITLDLRWLSEFVGISLELEKVTQILQRLGFTVSHHDTTIVCLVPSWRLKDVTIREDVAEEIMRVYGYYRLPSRLPATQLPRTTEEVLLPDEMKARYILSHLGFTEMYNHSLISKELADKAATTLSNALKLTNPLSKDYEYMRPSLLPSLLENLETNRGLSPLRLQLFENANTYSQAKTATGAKEVSTLSFITQGVNLSQAKGYLEALADYLHLSLRVIPSTKPFPPLFDPEHAGWITNSKGNVLGVFGSIREEVKKKFFLKGEVAAAELDYEQVSHLIPRIYHYQPVPAFTPIVEDLTFTFPSNSRIGAILEAIKTIHPLIKSVAFKSRYHHNLTLSLTYVDNQKQLTNKDVEPVRTTIVHVLESKFQAQLVGSLS